MRAVNAGQVDDRNGHCQGDGHGRRRHKRIACLLYTSTIALFLLGLCHILPLAAGSLCFVAQLGFLFVGYRKTNRILTPLFSLQDSLTPYETILRRLEQESFDSESLRELQGRLHGGGASATAGIQKLAGIAQGVYLRYNPVVYTLACGLLTVSYTHLEKSWV